MDVDRTRVGKTSESVQAAQPLGERPDAATLRHQVFRVDVGPHFQGLGRHHDQVTPAHRIRVTGRRHPGFRVEYLLTYPRRLAFAHTPGKEQDLRFRQRLAQALERLPRRLRRVAEHEAGSRRRRLPGERNGSVRERFRRVALCDLDDLKGFCGVQPLTDDRVHPVVVVQIEPFALRGISCRGQRNDRRLRAIRTKKPSRFRMAVGESGDQRPQVPREVRFVEQNQTVDAGHGGVDGPPIRPIASEQQTGAVHRQCAKDDRRPCGVRGGTRGDAAPKADHVQRRRIGIDP